MIYGASFTTHNDLNAFNNQIAAYIKSAQDAGQRVVMQFAPVADGNQILYTAHLLQTDDDLGLIYRFFIITNENPTDFANQVAQNLGEFQNAGLKVDVQYQPVTKNGRVLYTACLIGRNK